MGKPRGRPREFDLTEALESAVRVFRERGFNATSISDLQKATELASGSIYKAFKDKRAVFSAAFNRYTTKRTERLRVDLEKAVTGRDKLRQYLTFYAQFSFGKEGRIGCLVVGSAIEIMRLDEQMASIVKDTFTKNEALIADLIRLGQKDGSISSDVDCEKAARLMLCIVQGMRVIGKLGKTRDEMMSVVHIALKAID